jgi:hypothetical protein
MALQTKIPANRHRYYLSPPIASQYKNKIVVKSGRIIYAIDCVDKELYSGRHRIVFRRIFTCPETRLLPRVRAAMISGN